MRLELLPAAHGDALLVEWPDGRTTRRMLVDAGPLGTYRGVHDRLAALGRRPRRIDLLVVTHVDGDHIEGVVRMLQDRAALGLDLRDVWFNGWPQLAELASDRLGADQGEMVGALLRRDRIAWNTPFADQPVALPDDGPLPVVELPGGATLTLVGPGRVQLQKLKREWVKVLRELGVTPGDPDAALERLRRRPDLSGVEDLQGGRTKLDNSVANGSSISFLLEHGGRSLLLTGDGHGGVLADGLRRLLAERGRARLEVDALKLPHHGSRGNVTEELLALVTTPRYLFSTNGARYKHPDEEAVMRVLEQPEPHEPPHLVFNYRSRTTERWEDPATQRRLGYTASYPVAGTDGIAVDA